MAGFHDIIGHDMVKDHLQKAIEYHKVSHAYILSGEEGIDVYKRQGMKRLHRLTGRKRAGFWNRLD